MNNYLTQFKNLPKELRDAVSSEEKVKNLEEIEKKYNLKLAKLVVRLIIKDINWSDLEKFLQENFKLSPEKAAALKKDLSEKIFNEVLKYLGAEKLIETAETQKLETEKIEIGKLETGKDELELGEAIEEAKTTFLTEIPRPTQPAFSLEEIIKRIKEKLGLTFSDEISDHRFENIVLNFLKEIRKDFETEEVLTRSEKIAGLGLSLEKAKEIVSFLKEEKKKLEVGGGAPITPSVTKPGLAEGILTPQEIIKPPEVEEIPIETEEAKKLETEELIETMPEKLEAPPKVDTELKQRFDGGTIAPVFKKLEKPIEIPSPKVSPPLIGEIEGMPLGETIETEKLEKTKPLEEIPIKIRRPLGEEGLVEDVKIRPRAVGPIEELSEVTLTDLKRWSGRETAEIIFNKINLLGEESLTKKAEGIKAWQRSPLYRLYLEIGQESLEKEKTVGETIEERISKGEETMSLGDFEEITELNRKLRF